MTELHGERPTPFRDGTQGNTYPNIFMRGTIALIVVHILGVAVEWFLTGDNLVKAMVTGRKKLPAETAAREGKIAPAPVV